MKNIKSKEYETMIEEMKTGKEVVITPWGKAKKHKSGYYRITSTIAGKEKELVHRLVFEEYNNCKLDSNDVIHHIDNNPYNNHHTNLTCMSKKAHQILHHFDNHKNTTGYFRVSKQQCKTCKQGFTWAYWYMENGKHRVIQSTSIEELEVKVRAKGLVWIKF